MREPGAWSTEWTCARHGAVAPLHPTSPPRTELLTVLGRRATVPMWVLWPLPPGWLVSGVAWAGDERTGPRAIAVSCCGPAPLGGPADLVVVSEELGVGLGAHVAGLPGPDPGPLDGPPELVVRAGRHRAPVWAVPGAPDRAVYVGEAHALWLWLVVWPAQDAALIVEDAGLADLRVVPVPADLPVGALPERVRRAVTR